MLYTGKFSSINDRIYQVDIVTGNSTAPWDGENGEITLSGNPVVITSDSDGLFSPIKSRSCTIEMVSPEYHMDLYQPSSRGAKVTVYDITITNNPTKIFVGWLTPCSYSQDFTYLDSIQLEAVDAISSAKDFRIETTGTFKSFFEILSGIIKRAGYRGRIYFPQNYKISADSSADKFRILEKLYISDSNFIDNDEEHTHWTEYEVLEEILKYMCWSLCPFGDDIYLMDYSKHYNDPWCWYEYNSVTGNFEYSTFQFPDNDIDINLTNLAPGTSQISIDDIYNKIEISDNIYEIEDISPDILDEDNHISVTKEITSGPSKTQWTKTTTKGALWWKKKNTTVTGYDFQTFCRLKPESGWKHYFYRMEDLECLTNESSDGTEYYYPGTDVSPYTNNIINRKINTHGCLVQHYAHLKEQGANNIPATIDWTSCLTFFVTNPAIGNGTGTFDLINKENLELPVLEYTMGESINWKPTSGTSWLTIKGDLYYQWDGTKYGEKDKDTLHIINDKDGSQMYFTAPVDKSVSIDENKYVNVYKNKNSEGYGLGFSCWKMKLQIGNKWWNGDGWVNYPTTFYIKYNNNPDGDNDEYVSGYHWMNAVNNVDYKDKVGVDGYCIPIDSTDSSAPTTGVLKLTIYTPTLIPEEIMSTFRSAYNNSNINMQISWKNLPPVIYVKDFELGFVYTDTSAWWDLSESETNKNDKVYVGYIDDSYVQDFSNLEFKINTSTPDKPISKSYVCTNNGFLSKLEHNYIHGPSTAKIQEYNVIDNYLDHYSDRKVIYEANLHGLYKPSARFTKSGVDSEEAALPGYYFIDQYEYNLRDDNNRIKFIQY